MSMGLDRQEHEAKDVFLHLFELWQEERENDEDYDMEAAEEFVTFARDYLDSNRPRQSFNPEANIGTVLSNNVRLTLCPLVEDPTPGSMAAEGQGAIPMRGNV